MFIHLKKKKKKRILVYLHKQRVSESQGTLKVLSEGVIQEAGPGDLAVLVLVHDELCGLARWVDDQRIPGQVKTQSVKQDKTFVNCTMKRYLNTYGNSKESYPGDTLQ